MIIPLGEGKQMSEQTDKRNWKCFLGMHQYSILEKRTTRDFTYSTSDLPSSIQLNIISVCDFCGKIQHEKVYLC